MPESSFVMIKPHAIEWGNEILGELDRYFERTRSGFVLNVPKQIIENHYSVHRGKPFFEYMLEEFIGSSVKIALYEGERDLIEKIREIVGPTNPLEASPETIRGKYKSRLEKKGIDITYQVTPEIKIIRNVIHASESSSEAKREIKVWEDYFENAVIST
jgi:nucleoside-diphosphate kinase